MTLHFHYFPRNGFAFSRTEFENHLVIPLKASLHHHLCLAWQTQQGTLYKLVDHWTDEKYDYLVRYLDLLTEQTTLKPAGRVRSYLNVVARVKAQDDAVQDLARDHYLKSFPTQAGALRKVLKIPEVTSDLFWGEVQQSTRQALIAAHLVGKRYNFEAVFGPVHELKAEDE